MIRPLADRVVIEPKGRGDTDSIRTVYPRYSEGKTSAGNCCCGWSWQEGWTNGSGGRWHCHLWQVCLRVRCHVQQNDENSICNLYRIADSRSCGVHGNACHQRSGRWQRKAHPLRIHPNDSVGVDETAWCDKSFAGHWQVAVFSQTIHNGVTTVCFTDSHSFF